MVPFLPKRHPWGLRRQPASSPHCPLSQGSPLLSHHSPLSQGSPPPSPHCHPPRCPLSQGSPLSSRQMAPTPTLPPPRPRPSPSCRPLRDGIKLTPAIKLATAPVSTSRSASRLSGKRRGMLVHKMLTPPLARTRISRAKSMATPIQ